MLKKTKLLGESETAYVYTVSLVLDAGSAKFIEMAEGRGTMVSAAGHFALIDILRSNWTQHLESCGALWLRDFANLDPPATAEDILNEFERRNDE